VSRGRGRRAAAERLQHRQQEDLQRPERRHSQYPARQRLHESGESCARQDKLDRALAQDPSNPEVHSVRGMLFDKMGMPKDADAEFRTALRLAPKDPTSSTITRCSSASAAVPTGARQVFRVSGYQRALQHTRVRLYQRRRLPALRQARRSGARRVR
jgi:hypothetical protein